LITICLLILIIAISNYTILSLGLYLQSIGDVGIRTAMAAVKKDIFSVFLCEAFIITFFSMNIAGLFSSFLLTKFGKVAQTEIYTNLIPFSWIATFMILL